MKIPKYVTIGGFRWRIIKDKTFGGGSFNGSIPEIRIGTKQGKDDINITFLHEIMEAILAEKLFRYKKGYKSDDNGNYLFIFNHQELEYITQDLCLALKDVLK